MRRPAGVILAAIVMALIALVGLFASVPSLVFSIFSHSRVIPNLPGVRAALIAGAALMLAFFLFCAFTVVRLIGMRRSGRVSAVVIGAVIFFFSGLSGLGILFARQYAALLPGGPASGNVQNLLIGVAGFYFLVACIGLWWIVYFNLASVRAAFAEANAPLPIGRPAPVINIEP